MALLSANDPKLSAEKAPGDTGADSVLKDQAKKNSRTATPKKVNPDKEVSFYVSFAPEGKASIALPFPVLKENGELTEKIEHKQVTLKDKFFTVQKKDLKNDEYWKQMKKLLVDAGLEMFSTVKNLEELKEYRSVMASRPIPKAKLAKIQKVFGCFHPEHLSSELDFTVAFQCGEKVRSFKMVKGRLFTTEKELHSIFLKNGFEDMGFVKDSVKPSKEILPQKDGE